ncbi:MAG: hypothetical protein ABI640_04445 [Gammaproteobacteria bacterium]
MEARIARLEADVAHLRTDVGDIKVDLRTLRGRMDTKLDALTGKITSAKVWALLLYFTLAAGVFGTVARAFGWI